MGRYGARYGEVSATHGPQRRWKWFKYSMLLFFLSIRDF